MKSGHAKTADKYVYVLHDSKQVLFVDPLEVDLSVNGKQKVSF